MVDREAGVPGLEPSLARLVAGEGMDDLSILAGIRSTIPGTDARLASEIRGLRAAATHFGIVAALGGDHKTAAELMEATYAYFPEEAPGLRARARSYAGAMAVTKSNSALDLLPLDALNLPFQDHPSTNVGTLFAHFCGAPRHPVLGVMGSTLFVTTVQEARRLVGSEVHQGEGGGSPPLPASSGRASENHPDLHDGAAVKAAGFEPWPFFLTSALLLVAPLAAAADVVHSYLPFALLRLWMIGFAAYALVLARRAERSVGLLQILFFAIGFIFLFVWDLEVEQWAVIDLIAAAVILLSVWPLRRNLKGA